MRGMNQSQIGWLLTVGFIAGGIIIYLSAGLIAKLHEKFTKAVCNAMRLEWLLKWQLDENTNRLIIRIVGIALICAGLLVAVIAPRS